MPRYAHVPGPTIRRLSLYLRQLEALQASGQVTVSSRQLGQSLRVTDAQVRKDLAYFGQFGRPGIGYQVSDLIQQARRILGTDQRWRAVLIGAGNLGRALASYRGFVLKGFEIVAVFDDDPSKIGQELQQANGFVVRPMSELAEVVEAEQARIGILTVPASAAQAAAEKLIAAGVQGILCFAPVALDVPPRIPVAGVDLAVNLEQLSFQVRESMTD
jgi:redox-sensing transcriptional repressor